ncbi:MAG: DinB family protein [Pseudomonadota bacterium]|nr:DinB family protein [Pseudomonadota bacterium]
MPNACPNGSQYTARMMTHYMAWANKVMLAGVAKLPDAEIVKPRPALFGNIAHTFNHILVIEKIFQAHLEGTSHPYRARNTETAPPFAEVRDELERMDWYYIDLAARLSEEDLATVIDFAFVDGGTGSMSRFEILLHLANHATYHRGFISDMLYQNPPPGGRQRLYGVLAGRLAGASGRRIAGPDAHPRKLEPGGDQARVRDLSSL